MTKKEIKVLLKQNVGRFYTYELLRPTEEPFYVGKGLSGQGTERIFQHENQDKRNPLKLNIINKIKQDGGQLRYKICELFDEEKDAFALEIDLIAKYGRRNNGTGILSNMTDGGEGASGITEETRKNRRKKRILFFENNPEAKMQLVRWAKDNPEKYKEALKRSANTHKTEKFRQESSKREREVLRNNPGIKIINSIKMKNWWKYNTEEAKIAKDKSAIAHRTEEYRAQASERMKKQYMEGSRVPVGWGKNAEKRKANVKRERALFFENNPEAKRWLIKWKEDNPEKDRERAEKSIATHRTEEYRKRAKKNGTLFYENNIEARERLSKKSKDWIKNNPTRVEAIKKKASETKAKRTSICLRCLGFIKGHDIDIVTPKSNASLLVWQKFEEELGLWQETLSGVQG